MESLELIEFKTNVYELKIPSEYILYHVIEGIEEKRSLLFFTLKQGLAYNTDHTYQEKLNYMNKVIKKMQGLIEDEEIYTEDDILLYVYYNVFFKNRSLIDTDFNIYTDLLEQNILNAQPSTDGEEFLKYELKYFLLHLYSISTMNEVNLAKTKNLLEDLKTNKERYEVLKAKYHFNF